jgi:hypothetical protein
LEQIPPAIGSSRVNSDSGITNGIAPDTHPGIQPSDLKARLSNRPPHHGHLVI